MLKIKEIKILLIISLFVAFGLTGLIGFAFAAGCVIGDLIVEELF